MVAETIKKVQEAEGKADTIAKECRQQCTDMVDQAKKDAAALKEARLQEAKDKAGAAMEASKKEAEKFMESVEADIQKELMFSVSVLLCGTFALSKVYPELLQILLSRR